MGRNKISILLYIIVGLAGIGLVSSLINNPMRFLISILIGVAVAYVIYLIITRLVLNRNTSSNDHMKKYRKAAKQSNQKYNNHYKKVENNSFRKSAAIKVRKKRRHAPHLRVIEGNKTNKNSKNDDRASN